jgi:hypothetical protein
MKRSDFLRLLPLTGLAAKFWPAKAAAETPAPTGRVRLAAEPGESLEMALRRAIAMYRARNGEAPDVFWARERTVLDMFGEFGGVGSGGYQAFRFEGVDFIHHDRVPERHFWVGKRCPRCVGAGFVGGSFFGYPVSGYLPLEPDPVRPCPYPTCEAPK